MHDGIANRLSYFQSDKASESISNHVGTSVVAGTSNRAELTDGAGTSVDDGTTGGAGTSVDADINDGTGTSGNDGSGEMTTDENKNKIENQQDNQTKDDAGRLTKQIRRLEKLLKVNMICNQNTEMLSSTSSCNHVISL